MRKEQTGMWYKKAQNETKTNPFDRVKNKWEYEHWERLKDVDTTTDENEDKDFSFDDLDDYVIQRSLNNYNNPSKNDQLASGIAESIDSMIASNPEWANFPEDSRNNYEWYDKYFAQQLDKMGGKPVFSKLLEQKSNEIFPQGYLRHDVNGPHISKKLKKANERFDGWSHHYITSNGTLTPDMNHREQDEYVVASIGIHPGVVQNQGWLFKYANAIYVSYLNGELSVSINPKTTEAQEKKLYELCNEVLAIGGKIYWAYGDKEQRISISGSSLQGLIWFLDDKEKGKINRNDIEKYA